MKCTACGKDLPYIKGIEDATYQFDGALWVGFFGGYGMFVDDIDTEFGIKRPMLKGAAEEAVLCEEDADALCKAVPWLGKLLKPGIYTAETTS